MEPRLLLVGMMTIGLTLAGCVSPSGDAGDDVESQALGDVLIEPVTNLLKGNVQVSAGTPVRTINYGGSFVNEFPVNEAFNGMILELDWEAASPASEELSLWVREAGAGTVPPEDPQALLFAGEPLAVAEGASPLRLALAPDAIPEPGTYEIVVRATQNGVAIEQPYALHVTTFEGALYDEAFSALDNSTGDDGDG